MLALTADIMAKFRVPEDIGTNPRSLLLVLPLLAAIAVIYKATKVPKVTVGNFLKETMLLFGSILVFMVITALVLAAVAWLVIG
jgi:DNA integrity scanning protein DisA with diadenylate cyclase activity